MKQKSVGAVASTAAWVFGIATSVLFVALWGRAVIIDTNELSENLTPLSEAGEVANVFSDWMTAELIDAGASPEVAAEATDTALVTTEVSRALEGIVVDVVEAAASDGAEGGSVDVAAAFAPAVPALTTSMNLSGIPVSESQVSQIVSGLDPIVIREASEPAIVGENSRLATQLGTAVLLAVLAQIVFGSLYIFAGPDRLRRFRTLLTRFALTGISFAVLLKLGSWVLDPRGGRAPVSQSISMLADSKWLIPAFLGVAGAVAALFVWLIRTSVTPAATSPQQRATPTPRTG
jgi:hypothetical protein